MIGPTENENVASRTLKASAAFWFLAAVAGQWLFVYYIVAFYGPTLFTGNFESWNRNKGLVDGYVAGDLAGNLFLLSHVLIAAILTFGGTLQLIPQIRERAINFHRWNGRIFLFAATAAALAGLYLQWVRGTAFRSVDTGMIAVLGTTLDGLLILTFVVLAWKAIRAWE